MIFNDILQGSIATYLILRVLTRDEIGGVSDWNFWLLGAASVSVGVACAYYSRRADLRVKQATPDIETGADRG